MENEEINEVQQRQLYVNEAKIAKVIFDGAPPTEQDECLLAEIFAKAKMLEGSSHPMLHQLGKTAFERGYCAFVYTKPQKRRRALVEILKRENVNILLIG